MNREIRHFPNSRTDAIRRFRVNDLFDKAGTQVGHQVLDRTGFLGPMRFLAECRGIHPAPIDLEQSKKRAVSFRVARNSCEELGHQFGVGDRVLQCSRCGERP